MTVLATLRQQALAKALHDALPEHHDAVLQAPTGAGKSTLVPLLLLDDLAPGQKILMLEPRRLAARAVAARMASLLDQQVGQSVGYRMRLDTKVSAATRIEVLTEGVLTRMLQTDPALDGVAWVIFDEFHERSLAADLGLALALDARRQLATGPRILIMSATLELDAVMARLQTPARISVPGRAFPVSVQYLGSGLPVLPGPGDWREAERLVLGAVLQAVQETDGDVLVFLPGAGEIRRLESSLRERVTREFEILPLYGDMAAGAQDAVLQPAVSGRRKLVLATNIAETSLTIPGVTAVVDSGLVRRARFDPNTGMSRLELTRISRAASEQRAGRAGRLMPGSCYRLWSEGAHATLAAATSPEILDADLAPLALELARWGVRAEDDLPWLDPPPAASLQQARDLLQRLSALQAGGRLSPAGADMAQLPAHPRLAHMLLRARALGQVALATELAALLSERDLLGGSPTQRDPDIRLRLERLRAGSGERGHIERVRRQAQRLASLLPKGAGSPAAPALNEGDAVGALLALAFPDRIARRRAGEGGRYLLASGRGAHFIGSHSLARSDFIVAVDLNDAERDARIDLAAPLTRELLELICRDRIVNEERYDWDERTQVVSAHRIRRLEAITLEDDPLPQIDGERVAALLLQQLQRRGAQSLPWDVAARQLRARMLFVQRLASPPPQWPDSTDEALMLSATQWLLPYLSGTTRMEQLSRVPLGPALLNRLDRQQQSALEKLAPRALQVPTGSNLTVDYLDDNAPCVSVRLQEVFGMTQTPRIGGGAVPVTFKLLSPAQRPLQITRDLEGFWRSSYFEVRKEMRGRYPKHHWPEDPRLAEPTRRAKPRTPRG